MAEDRRCTAEPDPGKSAGHAEKAESVPLVQRGIFYRFEEIPSFVAALPTDLRKLNKYRPSSGYFPFTYLWNQCQKGGTLNPDVIFDVCFYFEISLGCIYSTRLTLVSPE
jgi:hypothetical protein